MLKAVASKPGGRDLLIIGLSFGNLDKFRAGPGDSYIRVEGAELGLPVDVMIFSAATEADLAALIKNLIGPKTKVTISDKLKS